MQLASFDRQRGQALAEFAIVIPLFFLMVVGILDVGRLIYINNALAEGAREGARWGAVQGRASTTTGLSSVADEVKGRLTAVPAPSVTVTCERLITSTTECSTGDILSVQVDAAVSPMTPIIGEFIGPLSFSSTAKMTIHG